MANVNYRKGGPAVVNAYFKYRKETNESDYSIPSFAAGFNAAMAVPSIIVTHQTLDNLQEIRRLVCHIVKNVESLMPHSTEAETFRDKLNWLDALIANAEAELAT